MNARTLSPPSVQPEHERLIFDKKPLNCSNEQSSSHTKTYLHFQCVLA